MLEGAKTKQLIAQIPDQEWKDGLEQASSKYHLIAAWVAILFDPIFAFTDYLNSPQVWLRILAIRLTITGVTLLILVFRKRFALLSYQVILVPFLLISLQNAYTYSLIGSEVILEHSLNYMALWVGGGMFILWEWRYSVLVVLLSVLATAFFVQANPYLTKEQFLSKGGFLLFVVGAFMVILIKTRYDLTVREIKARIALKASNEELERQKDLVETNNRRTTDSIHYAQRIQTSILGHPTRIDKWFSDAFVMFMPKDILSGDFYWFYEDPKQEVKIVIAADCTGHGIPASMMTVLGNTILNDVVIQDKVYSPEKILYALDQRLLETFGNHGEEENKVNDGMDVSILSFSKEGISFAAAKNPLCIITKEGIDQIPGSKYPIGSTQYGEDKVFERHLLNVAKGTKLYLYSDGFQDQFGGENNKKYLSKRLREFLLQTSTLSMAKQKELLLAEFDAWKGKENPNTDDVLIVGIEV